MSHEPIGPPDDAGDGHADADQRRVVPQRIDDRRRGCGDVAHGLVEREALTRTVDPEELMDAASVPDVRHRDGIDVDLDRERNRGAGIGLHEGRWPPRMARRPAWNLAHEAAGDELTDEAANRTPGQAGMQPELRTGERTPKVQLTDDRTQIGASDRLASLPWSIPRRQYEDFVFLSSKPCRRLVHRAAGCQ
jgi:hypothetical protein